MPTLASCLTPSHTTFPAPLQTVAEMEAYCRLQLPMGDTKLENFECPCSLGPQCPSTLAKVRKHIEGLSMEPEETGPVHDATRLEHTTAGARTARLDVTSSFSPLSAPPRYRTAPRRRS